MKAVMLAGGNGARLSPYTKILPKPLMPIGDMTILEVLLRQMKRAGIDEAILTVGHLASLIQTFFQNGERLDLHLTYSFEDRPLGTAGPLALVADQLKDTFLVANGDVLTTLDLNELIAAHHRSGAIVTIACHTRNVRIDLGVLQLDGAGRVTDYIEKPDYTFFASMGMYVFEPRVLKYIPIQPPAGLFHQTLAILSCFAPNSFESLGSGHFPVTEARRNPAGQVRRS